MDDNGNHGRQWRQVSRRILLITRPYSPIKQYLAFRRHSESESKDVGEEFDSLKFQNE